MFNGKEPVEVRGGVSSAAAIMEFWNMEGYDVGFLIGVAVVVFRSILGVYEGAGSVLSGGSFKDDCYGNLEGLRPG